MMIKFFPIYDIIGRFINTCFLLIYRIEEAISINIYKPGKNIESKTENQIIYFLLCIYFIQKFKKIQFEVS